MSFEDETRRKEEWLERESRRQWADIALPSWVIWVLGLILLLSWVLTAE